MVYAMTTTKTGFCNAIVDDEFAKRLLFSEDDDLLGSPQDWMSFVQVRKQKWTSLSLYWNVCYWYILLGYAAVVVIAASDREFRQL